MRFGCWHVRLAGRRSHGETSSFAAARAGEMGEGPVWRTVRAAGTEATELRSLVHYTDD